MFFFFIQKLFFACSPSFFSLVLGKKDSVRREPDHDLFSLHFFPSAENRGIHDPNLFEGDMYLTPRQRYKAEHGMDVDSDLKRGSSRLRLWPGGVVPYTISPTLGEFT